MKKVSIFAIAMALGVTASAYAANPFSDVPAGHWAYDSINKLAAAGVIEGYGDSTFGGDKLMTRYEMAQIVAKAMAKGANVDKLAAEFADELDNLGVRVANLEKKADNVKITGEVRYHYADNDEDVDPGYTTKLRSRIWLNGAVNEDWTYTAMIQNEQDFRNDKGDEDTKFQRAYVNGKIGGVAVQGGRYNLKLSDGNVYDERFDGIQASYGKDVKVTAGYGKASPSTPTTHKFTEGALNGSTLKDTSDEVWYGEVSGKISKLGLKAGYYSFSDVESFSNYGKDNEAKSGSDDLDIWAVGANYNFDNNVKLGFTYLKGEDSYGTYKDIDDDGYIATVSYKGAKAANPGSWGLTANYYDQGATTYVNHTMNGFADKMWGFKGYSVTANYTFAKNIVGQVEWYDLEEKEGDRDSQTLWGQLLFTF